MATRILKRSELGLLAPYLPLKQELFGRKVLLSADNGQLCCKLVTVRFAPYLRRKKHSPEAWAKDAPFLAACNDRNVQALQTIMDDEAVWVVFPPVMESTKPIKVEGYGLGSSFHAAPSVQATSFERPSVPEPWMGTFSKTQPVMPGDGIDWARARSEYCGSDKMQPLLKTNAQQTITSMFAKAPLKVEPMDF